MQYTIEIDGVSVSASQLNMVLTIDKTLDYGSFAVRNQVSEPFTVGDMVDIDITDGADTKSFHFIVSADDVTQLPSGYFLHTLNIIELTKILEWQTESVRTFTQKVDYIDPVTEELISPQKLTLLDVVVRLQFTAPIEKTANLSNTRIFAVDNAIRSRLAAVEVPDFQFNNKNLKETLIEVFDLIDAIPRLIKVSDSITLTADFYNERGATINEDSFYRMERFDIKDYSTALDADIQNLYDSYTDIVEPSETGFKRLTSKESTVTEENAFLQTQYPIVDIVKLEVNVDVSRSDGITGVTDTFSGALDLTNYIVEREQYDLLDNIKLTEGINTGRYRDNTLFFTRFSKDINVLYEVVGARNVVAIVVEALRKTRIDTIIQAALLEQQDFRTGDLQNYKELEFRITYKAQIDSRTEVKRLKTTAINYDSQTYVGQTDNVVRADRVLDRLFKLQQLLGNAEFMTSERVTAVDDLFYLSDRSTDDYVLTTIELDCNKNHITAKYMWSQAFQKVSDFIGLNNELRLYSIPSQSFKRNIYIEDFIEVGTEARTNNSLVEQTGVITFLNTINNTPNADANKPIRLFAYNSEAATRKITNPVTTFDGFDNETETIIKPVTAYSGGNSMNFHVEFENSTIAGVQMDLETQDNQPPINRPIIYTNNDGEVFDFEFALVNDATIDNSENVPIVEKTDLLYKMVDSGLHTIHKDTREVFAMTYALHVIPEEDLENTIIIGKYLVERNNLLKGISNASNQFEVFGTNTPYTLADNRFSRSTDTVVAQTHSITFGRLLLSGNVAFSTWGVRKKDTKELVVAVNQGDTNINSLYFNFRDKQTGVTYPSQTSQPSAIVKRPTQISLTPPSNNPTSSTIQIVWVDGNTDPVAQEFELGISDNLTNWTDSEQAPATTNAKTFSGLDPFTAYTIRIRARIGTDYSEWAYFTAATIAPAPDAPTNLTLTQFGTVGFRIDFDANERAFAHRIEISESNTFSPLIPNGFKSIIGSKTTLIVTNLIDGIDFNTEYFVRVRSIEDGQFSAFSDTASITTDSLPVTAPPFIINVSVSGNDVTFTLVNTDDQLVTLFADFVNAQTSRATSVRPNEARTFTIAFGGSQNTIFASSLAAGKSKSSIDTEQFIAIQLPGTPSIGATGIVVNTAFNVINYTYDSPPLTAGFVVERNPDAFNANGFGEISAVLSPDTRRFIDNTPLSGQSYTYRIRAFTQFGSTTSNERTVTSVSTVPNAPSSLAASVVLAGSAGEGAFTLTWQRNSTDEDGFLVQRRVGSAAFADVGGTAKGQTTIDQVIQGDANTTYNYRILAFNQFGNSTASNTVDVLVE